MVGEVEDPETTLPKGLGWAVVLVIFTYLIPLVVGIGVSEDWRVWDDGYFSEVGKQLGGWGLYLWIVTAACVSNVGLFLAEMSSDAYQLLGMAELGMLPRRLATRSVYDTPTLSILFSAGIILFASFFDMESIIEFLNFLYCLAELSEFAAFLWLRRTKPELNRPFKVPLSDVGCALGLLPAVLLLFVVMSLASQKTLLVSGAVVLLGLPGPWLLKTAREKGWCEFEDAADPLRFDGGVAFTNVMTSDYSPSHSDAAVEGILEDATL